MNDQRREITLGGFAMFFVTIMAVSQCKMADNIDRLADTADAQMCIEGVKARIDIASLPKPCQKLRKDRK